MFINRELRKIFGSKKEEITSGGRKLLSKRLRDIYSSPNIIRVTKSRKVRRAEPAARMGENKNTYKVLVEEPEGKRHSKDLDIAGRIILKWILKVGGRGSDSYGTLQRQVLTFANTATSFRVP
jgi:hypothetical protein